MKGENMRRSVLWMVIAIFAGWGLGVAGSAKAQPLKIYILAGQSNMQGHANISTIPSMASDPKTVSILKEMLNAEGKPKVCKHVWIASIGCGGNQSTEMIKRTGRLTVGFGASRQNFGPEFTFGIYTEKLLGGPILIIKTSWGGKSLVTDFRPPSAGPYVWTPYALAQLRQRRENIAKIKAEKIKATGFYYRAMMGYVRKVLANIKQVDPQYNPKQGYQHAGFAWFQGWNDLDNPAYPADGDRPGAYKLYTKLMADLIDDVRKELSAPYLPVVIGVIGVDGNRESPTQRYLRQGQTATALLPQFRGNVVAVQTAPFWNYHLEVLFNRYQSYWPKVNAEAKAEHNTSWSNKIRLMNSMFTPKELKELKAMSAFGFHYLGAAIIMAPIGKAFAEAIVKLDKNTKLPVIIRR